WRSLVHAPFLKARCAQSCPATQDGRVQTGYVASRGTERCHCRTAAQGGNGNSTQMTRGYFFARNAMIDGVLLFLFRAIPIALLLFFGFLGIAKLVGRGTDQG